MIENTSEKTFLFSEFYWEMRMYRTDVANNANQDEKEAILKGFDSVINEIKRREKLTIERRKKEQGGKRWMRVFIPFFLLLAIPMFIFSWIKWFCGYSKFFDLAGTKIGYILDKYTDYIE
jgi:polyferredoxin